MNHFFAYLARPENTTAAIIIMILWTLTCIAAGAIIGILICSRVDKKIKNANRHYSFDDFIEHTNRRKSYMGKKRDAGSALSNLD